jgi:hypothetical protein
MPSGRDSFRRNRVAPIGYCTTLLRLTTILLYHPRQVGMPAEAAGRFRAAVEACLVPGATQKQRGLRDQSKRGSSAAQADNFAGAKLGKKRRLASVGMTDLAGGGLGGLGYGNGLDGPLRMGPETGLSRKKQLGTQARVGD